MINRKRLAHAFADKNSSYRYSILGGKQNLYTLWRESITFFPDITTPPVLVNQYDIVKINTLKNMELQGKIIFALEPRSGVSARGEWKSQDFVIETHDTYPKKMVFSVFGAERLQRFNIEVGQEVNVSFDIDAHEYNGRWFNNIRAFDVRPVSAAPAVGMQPSAPFDNPSPSPAATNMSDPFANPETAADSAADDLPF